jgi:hypothetical protein
MIRVLQFIFIILFLLLSTTMPAEIRQGEMKVKIPRVSPEDFKKLDKAGFILDDYNLENLFLLVTPAELEKLRKSGFEPEIIIEDMNAFRNEILASPEYSQFHDYVSTLTLVDSLIQAFPNLIHKVSYGSSLQGRELYAVKISDNVTIDEPEPEISFDGCHHGDEIMGSEVIILLMRDLCIGYGNDPQITELVNSREIWIYPFMNPDGRQMLTRYNANGVDCNRDWGYMWDDMGNSSSPFSQPETKAIAEWIFNNQFVISQSNHGGTEAISHPWSYRPNSSPDQSPINFLASQYSNLSGYGNLAYFQGYGGMYPINGSAKDCFYGINGSVGWSMEVSNVKIPPPSQIVQYYNWNKAAMLNLIEMANRGVSGTVTDSISGQAISAIVWVSSNNHDYWPVYTDPVLGDYHKFLLSGMYNVKITANGYKSKTISNITVTDTGATTVDVQLSPNYGTYVHKIISCQISGNNFSNEGLTYLVLGIPDNKNYSIGNNGWAVFDMGAAIYDYPGNDFRVVEGDATPEGYTVEVSNDKYGLWTSLGNAVGTNEFDLSASGISDFQFIRIRDDNLGPSGADAGFDLDAIEGRLIPTSGPYLVATNYSVSDTLSNYNGIFEAGESTSFELIVQNLGVDPAQSGSVKLSSNSKYLNLIVDSIFVGDIFPDEILTIEGFWAEIPSTTPHHSIDEMQVTFQADNGYEVTHSLNFEIRTGAKIFVNETNQQIYFEPAYINSIMVYPLKIYNNGEDSLHINSVLSERPFFWSDVQTALIPPNSSLNFDINFLPLDTLQYLDTLTIFNDDPVNFEFKMYLSGSGILAPDITINTDSIYVSMQTTDSLEYLFTIENIGAGDLNYTAQIGNYPNLPTVKIEGGGGSDVFGHVWADSDDPNGPQFNWIEIGDGSGTEISFGNSNAISNPIPLGFSIPMYDTQYAQVRICTNGWLSFTTFSVSYNNTDLPHQSAPKSLVAPLWDNLLLQSDSKIFYRGDAAKFLVQWEQIYTQSGYGPYTFQVQILDNGNFIFQYKELNSIEHLYTIGLQNGDATDGFSIAYNENYLHDQLAILIKRHSWIHVHPESGTISPGNNEMVRVIFKTSNFTEEDFWASVKINSNDPDASSILLPVHMLVSGIVSLSKQDKVLPEEIMLYQNFPNPFNPTTTITFQIPEKSDVQLLIYNTLGQVIKLLMDDKLDAGEYQVVWNATNDFGQNVPSGIYFYELKTNNFSQIKKMILLH